MVAVQRREKLSRSVLGSAAGVMPASVSDIKGDYNDEHFKWI